MITCSKLNSDKKIAKYHLAGKFMVVASEDGSMYLQDIGSYLEISGELYKHSFGGQAMADIQQGHYVTDICSKNDDLIASSGSDGSIMVYSLSSNSLVMQHNHGTSVQQVAFYGQSLLAAGSDGILLQLPLQQKYFWSSSSVKVLFKLPVSIASFVVVGDNLVLATAASLVSYSFDQKSVTSTLSLELSGTPLISSSGQYVLSGLSNELSVYSVSRSGLKFVYKINMDDGTIDQVLFHGNFIYLITGNTLQIRSAAKGKLVLSTPVEHSGSLMYDGSRTCYIVTPSSMLTIKFSNLDEIDSQSLLAIMQNRLQFEFYNQDRQFKRRIDEVALQYAEELVHKHKYDDAVNVLQNYKVNITAELIHQYIKDQKLQVLLPLLLDLRQQLSGDLIVQVLRYCLEFKLYSWIRLGLQLWMPLLHDEFKKETVANIQILNEESAMVAFLLYDSLKQDRQAFKCLLNTSDTLQVIDYYQKLKMQEALSDVVDLLKSNQGLELSIEAVLDEISKGSAQHDSEVITQLKPYRRQLNSYLHAVHSKDQKRTEPYRDLQVELYAEFGKDGQLLHFLERSSDYDLRKALKICEDRVAELVVIYRKIGDFRKALETLTSSGNEQSIFDFCKQINDPDIWQEVQQLSISNRALMRLLLLHAHEHIDLSSLVRMIPDNTPIQSDINQAMCGALKEQIVYKNLVAGCSDIFAQDARLLLLEFLKHRRQGRRQQL